MAPRFFSAMAGVMAALVGIQQGALAAPGMPVSSPAGSELEERVIPCRITTHLVGDGDPHQNYLLRQVTEVTECDPESTCQTGYGKGGSFGVEVGISGEYEWISGGFAVSKEWSEEETHNCDGNPGASVCVWYRAAYTAYTVKNSYSGECLTSETEPYVMKSPNTNNAGGAYYCVVGTCREKGAEYWDENGPAGGP